ncbi:MAG: glutamate--tRNA ligase [Hyphomicrobiales bacterium]
MSDIVTRFAPSPTGFLHIGGARTALFNWLYARHHGGRMLLRIEDTDRQRSTEPAIAAILDGLKWLGLDWDGETVFQFARVARHAEAALSLVASGNAYPCYASKDELDEMREAAKREGRPMRYDGRWRDRDLKEAPPGLEPVIRLRAPNEGETVVEDMVQGRVIWQNKELDDLVLLRSDGTPTYMLAVVVDDHDMGVTDIIRGDDHLTNAARQMQIYRAFGWEAPRMAHIPLIHGPDGAKLSKRHGALGVDAYRELGYLPAALRNYLVRLGWSHGDQEVFSTQEMIDIFSLETVGRSPARFDFAKLENLNGLYIRATPDAELVEAIERILPQVGPGRGAPTSLDAALRARWLAAMPGLKERAKTLLELIDAAYYLYGARPLALDAKAKALLAQGANEILARIGSLLAALNAEWTAQNLEALVRGFAEREALKLGQVAQPLRAALTGRATSPGLFDVMVVLGREECLARLSDAAAHSGGLAA